MIVINHGSVIYDDEVGAMRRSILATKLIEVTLGHPVAPVSFAGATVTEQTATTLKLVVALHGRPVRSVVDELLATLPVSDLSIVDPPLEQVIGSIYDAPRRPDAVDEVTP